MNNGANRGRCASRWEWASNFRANSAALPVIFLYHPRIVYVFLQTASGSCGEEENCYGIKYFFVVLPLLLTKKYLSLALPRDVFYPARRPRPSPAGFPFLPPGVSAHGPFALCRVSGFVFFPVEHRESTLSGGKDAPSLAENKNSACANTPRPTKRWR
jgi:hypothetical protein